MIKDEELKISKFIKKQFDKEYLQFCKWARSDMTKNEFLEFMILQSKHTRLNHRVMWTFYSITPKKIGILDRKNNEKIVVRRIHDYLYCDQHEHILCGHCLFCFNDKDVKKSLNQKYVQYQSTAFRSVIIWAKFIGQKLDFEKIIGNKTIFDDDFVRLDSTMYDN